MPAGNTSLSAPPGIRSTDTAEHGSERTSGSDPVKVVVFSDHPVFQSSLGWKITPESGIHVVADIPSLHETISLASEFLPDVVVADLRIGDGNSEGVQSVASIADTVPDVPVVVLTDYYSSSSVARMTEAGAAAIMQKSTHPDTLAATLLEVAFERREREAAAKRNAGDAA